MTSKSPLLPVSEALSRILETAGEPLETESVELAKAHLPAPVPA